MTCGYCEEEDEYDCYEKDEQIIGKAGELIELKSGGCTLETRLDMMKFCLDVCCTEFNKVNSARTRTIKMLASQLLLAFLQTVDPEEYEYLAEEKDEEE